MRGTLQGLIILVALAAPAGPALADATTEAQLRAALQASTAQIATLEDQVANLQAAQAPDDALINTLQAQVQTLKQQAGSGGKIVTAAASDAADERVAALNRQLSARGAALARAQGQAEQFSSAASSSAAANTQLTARLAVLHGQFSACDTRNAALYKLGNQILDAYSHKDDVFGTIADREPFIGFKRVQLQNIVQDDQDKLDDNQLNSAPNP